MDRFRLVTQRAQRLEHLGDLEIDATDATVFVGKVRPRVPLLVTR
jgi:hypothetical protein